MIDSLLSFFFPEYCIDCGKRLHKQERHICEDCFRGLPKYEGMERLYHPQDRFAGLVPFSEVESDLIFSEHSTVREIIHSIKYNNCPEFGKRLARRFATRHLEQGHFQDVSMIIPIPLAPKRMRKRGYNQSEFIARGLGEVLGLEVHTEILHKLNTDSQTGKTKTERWETMKEVFYIQKNAVRGKRILLVDDLLTSGATMTHAARTLYTQGGAQSVSFYTLALDVYL